jgi:hypothetical protein
MKLDLLPEGKKSDLAKPRHRRKCVEIRAQERVLSLYQLRRWINEGA